LLAESKSVLEELRQLLGRRCDFEPAEITDERGLFSARPLCVVYPETTDELSQILALANQRQVPIVPLGGNTGLCAGAVPHPEGKCVVLSLSKLQQVRHCDEINYSIAVEAGLTVAEVAAEAEARGMYFPLRFGADATAQIGGSIATNAGGSGVLRYGNTRELVLGLEVVLADGRVLSGLEGLRKDNTGYDLKQLFIGSEGTLGVCSAVTLKLFPPLPHRQVALAEVASLTQAVELFKAARDEVGELLLAFEWMSAPATAISVGKGLSPNQAGMDNGSDLVLLELASALPDEPALRMEKLLTQAIDSGLVSDAKIAASQSDTEKMWSLRELIPQGEKRQGGSLKHDVSVAISALAEFVESASQAAKAVDPDVKLCLYGHIGDGNIHFNLLPSSSSSAQATALSEAVYGAVSQYGGSFSAEHGIGMLHTATLSRYKDPVAVNLMRQLKSLLDPNNILNPGKVIA